MSVTKRKKKTEKWETVEVPEQVPLKLPPFNARTLYGDLEYATVGTHLDILGMQHVAYVGMIVKKGDEVIGKMIEMDEVAHRFLVAQGLPIMAAKALVSLAIALRDEPKQD